MREADGDIGCLMTIKRLINKVIVIASNVVIICGVLIFSISINLGAELSLENSSDWWIRYICPSDRAGRDHQDVLTSIHACPYLSLAIPHHHHDSADVTSTASLSVFSSRSCLVSETKQTLPEHTIIF